MHRIDSAGATINSRFTEGDPSTGVPATVVSADFMNTVQEELINVVQGANISPKKSDDTQVLTAIKALVKSEMANLYMPVGTIYGNDTDSRNPAVIFGFGKWVAIKGRSLVGVDGSDSDFDTAGEEGGSKDHSHTTQNAGSHNHGGTNSAGSHIHTVSSQSWNVGMLSPSPNTPKNQGELIAGSGNTENDETLESLYGASGTKDTSSAGSHSHSIDSDGSHSHSVNSSSNLSPYRAVYLWRRTE